MCKSLIKNVIYTSILLLSILPNSEEKIEDSKTKKIRKYYDNFKKIISKLNLIAALTINFNFFFSIVFKSL